MNKSILFSFLILIFLSSSCNLPTAEMDTPVEPEENLQEEIEIIFIIEPQEIKKGECSTLFWDASGSFIASIDEEEVTEAGNMQICPEESREYELTADFGDRVEQRQAKIVVIEQQQEESEAAAPPPVPQTKEIPQVEPGTPAYQAGEWIFTGGPVGGLGYDIRMDPRDPDMLYVTDAWAGVFKSTDGGQNWFASSEGITTRVGHSGDAIPIFSLTIDPNNPDIIWAGTQFASGAFRSDDMGATWKEMSSGIQEHGLTIRGFTVAPGNSDVVYLAGEVSSWEWAEEPRNGIMFDLTKGVVYKSTNRGESWERIWYGDNLARYVIVHPDDPDLIYVSTGIFDREAANSDPDTLKPGGVGILRSHDGGETWEVLDEKNGIDPLELYFSSLVMHPENPDILIGASANDAYLWVLNKPIGGVYLTEDGGDNWQRTLRLNNASSVEICESNPEIVYAGSYDGIYRSDNGGYNWQEMAGIFWGSEDTVAGFPIDMQCDPRDPMRIFVNNYLGGNFLSEDGGQTWQVSSTGYTGALMNAVEVAWDDPLLVYAASRNGVFVSHDGGQNWHGMSRGVARPPEATGLAVNPGYSQNIITTLVDGGPVPKITYDGGQNWFEFDQEYWYSEEFHNSFPVKILFSPHNTFTVFALRANHDCQANNNCETGYGIVFSEDGGRTWGATNMSDKHPTDIAFHPTNNSILYASVFPNDVYRSEDGGVNWEQIADEITAFLPQDVDPDIPPLSINALEADPFEADKLYAAIEGGPLLISLDGGLNWNQSIAGMPPEINGVDIAADPSHEGVVYLATSNMGVFYTTDGGGSWRTLNDGLITRAGVDLALSRDGSILYLATSGGGVFSLGAVGE